MLSKKKTELEKDLIHRGNVVNELNYFGSERESDLTTSPLEYENFENISLRIDQIRSEIMSTWNLPPLFSWPKSPRQSQNSRDQCDCNDCVRLSDESDDDDTAYESWTRVAHNCTMMAMIQRDSNFQRSPAVAEESTKRADGMSIVFTQQDRVQVNKRFPHISSTPPYGIAETSPSTTIDADVARCHSEIVTYVFVEGPGSVVGELLFENLLLLPVGVIVENVDAHANEDEVHVHTNDFHAEEQQLPFDSHETDCTAFPCAYDDDPWPMVQEVSTTTPISCVV